ncbi:hypothetical protein E4V51_03410 [Paenibacillus sp. 28ISP30-2]|nr:hypothetical protein [Paenibacillus sp. 28ISP30-2]
MSIIFSKKVVSIVLSSVMMLGFSASAFATTGPVNTTTPSEPSYSTNIQENNSVETQGFKRWFAEKAVKGIAAALRAGANNTYVKKAIAEYFDDATAKVFKRNLDNIADVLDDAVRTGDLASAYIKDKIFKLMYSVTGDYGIAESIADGVVTLIDIFL